MDSMIELIGPFGLAQKFYILIIGFSSSLVAIMFYSSVFIMAVPNLVCFIKNESYPITHYTHISNETVPTLEKCVLWDFKRSKTVNNLTINLNCEYQSDYFNHTLVNEWDLICDLSQTVYFIGTVLSLFSGTLGDKYGRKKLTLIFLIYTSISTCLTLFFLIDTKFINLNNSIKFFVYCVYQFSMGYVSYSIYTLSSLLLLEYTTCKYHTLSVSFMGYFFCLGELYLLLVFYLSRSWKTTFGFYTLYSVLNCILFCIFIPESPKWLKTKNNINKLNKVMKKMGKINGIKNLDLNDEVLSSKEESPIDETSCGSNFLEILWPIENLSKIFKLIVLWNSLSLNYIGVSLSISVSLDTSPFSIFLLSTIFEAIGTFICNFNEKIGQKRALIIYLMLSAICLFSFSLLPETSNLFGKKFLLFFKLILLLASRAVIQSSYITSFTLTAELFPTKNRTTGILLLNSAGSIFSFIAPQINLLGSVYWKSLPYLIYSLSSILACVAIRNLKVKNLD